MFIVKIVKLILCCKLWSKNNIIVSWVVHFSSYVNSEWFCDKLNVSDSVNVKGVMDQCALLFWKYNSNFMASGLLTLIWLFVLCNNDIGWSD